MISSPQASSSAIPPDSTESGNQATFNSPVFYPSAAIMLLLVLFAIIAPQTAADLFDRIQGWILYHASWFYILTVAIVLLATVFLAISRYGNIKLGLDHSEPDYRNLTWFAMLFSAGMGIGILFFGVAEPVMHFIKPPLGEPGTALAAREAMKLTFFHWGLHAWALYAIVALILAFFSYRHGLPLTMRSALFPLIGNRIHGPIGKAVDIFAIISTVLGVATSLGLGVAQINSGLNHLWGVPISITSQIVLIIIACGAATLSVASGLDKGIKILSQFNLGLAVLLMLFVLVVGPTVFILQTFMQNTGGYLSDIVNKTFNLYAYEATDWIGGWTLFYWGWWLAWSPFVGMFIARISRGRTIREFVCGVLLVPAGFTLFWMTVFGDSVLHMILMDGVSDLTAVVDANKSLALFVFLEQLPLSAIVNVVAIVMVMVFFVTSADSGALVVDLLASGGRKGTPMWHRVFWSVAMGAVAIALLLADGLAALQTATIASALPFSVILLMSIFGLFKALRLDITKRDVQFQPLNLSRPAAVGDAHWKRRLRNIVMMPRHSHVTRFITDTVRPAFDDVAEAWRKEGYEVTVSSPQEDAAEIVVSHNDLLDFTYAVHAKEHTRPSLSSVDQLKLDDNAKYFRAEVHLQEGGQDYDIMGWNRDEVIGDILDQYERHRHYLHIVSLSAQKT